MTNKVAVGSIVTSNRGISREVLKVDGVRIVIADDEGNLKVIDRDRVVGILHPNPRNAVIIASGRVEVDLDRLSLDYQPQTLIPQWQPSVELKPYEELTKIYIDIETTGLNPKTDRVLMVGLLDDRGETTILTDPDEKTLLAQTIEHLKQHQPECLIGHNLINFDLPFLADRCRVHNISHPFKKGNKTSRITSSTVNGKPIEFTPIYWNGVNILDTYQQIAIWDKQAAKLDRYDLKSSVIALGLRDDRRLELSVNQIRECWESGDTETIENYLKFDLDDTQLLAEFLLPVVYYQLAYVPALSFQQIAIASPALKAQKIHEKLLPRLNPQSDEPLKYDGGKVELVAPGLHQQVAKIDVSSLYPSIMLRYGICSRKDIEHKFLGALAYMVDARLKLKALAKSGEKSAAFQEKSLKILINGSYGFMGTGFYTFNDYEAAALVTAYGRKILDLMVEVVTSCGGVVIEIDTDGILFSHDEPETVKGLVSASLPTGINIDLELTDCGLYAPKAKSYVIVHPNGKTTVKGLFRKRNRYALENKFPIEFLRLYFIESPQAAEEYYYQTRLLLVDRRIDVADLTINRKIGSAEKNLVELGIGKPGDRVSYWFTEGKRHHAKTAKALLSHPLETTTEPYWADYYIDLLDGQYKSILGREKVAEIMPKSAPIQLEIVFA
jgi:DNA polymerase, archaea type